MIDLRQLDGYRLVIESLHHYGDIGDAENGMFALPSPIDQKPLKIVASIGAGWEHVSVSRLSRCPNWLEMDFVKRAFFKEEETVMQLHPPRSEWVNDHPFCLHLWRPTDTAIPRPPKWMVGGMSREEAEQAAQQESAA